MTTFLLIVIGLEAFAIALLVYKNYIKTQVASIFTKVNTDVQNSTKLVADIKDAIKKDI